jgi:hypothetical protein
MTQVVRSSWQHIWKLTVDEVADRDVGEQTHSGNSITRPRTRCVLGVQRVEDRTNGKVYRPYHRRRCDKDTLANATNREANQLGRHDKQPLVFLVKNPSIDETEEASADETYI